MKKLDGKLTDGEGNAIDFTNSPEPGIPGALEFTAKKAREMGIYHGDAKDDEIIVYTPDYDDDE